MDLPPGIYERRGPRGVKYQAKVSVPPHLQPAYGGKRQLAQAFPTIEQAVLWRIAVQREHDQARPWIPPRPGEVAGPAPLSDALADWLKARKRTKAPRTVHVDATTVELFLDFLWSVDRKHSWLVADLSRDLVADFYSWLLKPREDGAKRKISTATKHVQALVVAWRWLEDSDTHGRWTPRPRSPDLPKRVPTHVVAPTWGEWDQMMAALRGSLDTYGGEWTWRGALLVRGTFRRRGAVLNLDWRDVDLERRRVRWRAEHDKTSAEWLTPLPAWLAEEMAGWGVREGLVCEPPELELTGRGHIDRTIRRAWKRSGVPRDRWHGRPLHCARRMAESELGVHHGQAVLDWYVGHVTPGEGPRSYRHRDRYAEALWPQLQTLAEAIPAPAWQRVATLSRAVQNRNG